MEKPHCRGISKISPSNYCILASVRMAKGIVWYWKVFKQYLANCNIHGLRYFVDDGFSLIERLFWVAMCALCWWGCTIIIINVVRNYIEHPVAVTADSRLTGEPVQFPAIAVCYDTTLEMRQRYFKKNPGSLNSAALTKKNVPAEELLAAYNEMILPCNNIIANCTWRGKPFNCCEEFTLLPKTGVGPCLIFNSYVNRKSKKQSTNFYIDGQQTHGDVIIEFIADSKTGGFMPKSTMIYVMNSYQIPIVTTDLEFSNAKLKKGQMSRVYFTMQDMLNDDGVKGVPVKRRNCRFSDELAYTGPFPVYSRDICSLQVYITEMIKYCGCVHFYYTAPEGVETCNITSLQCLLKNAANIKSSETVKQYCVPDCQGTELELFYVPGVNIEPNSAIKLHVKMMSYPSIRYRRYVVHTLLDVIVAIGSAMGLFMGASLLSICEVPYWLFIRRDKVK